LLAGSVQRVMNQRHLQFAIAALVACLSALQASADEPGTSPPRGLLFYYWQSSSPGNETTYTSLNAIEVDLVGKRFRLLMQSAGAPKEMLPHDQKGVAAIVSQKAWHQLSEQRTEHLATLVALWRDTNPPQTYKQSQQLGTEDDYVETLHVHFAKSSIEIAINARDDADKGDPSSPPPEWHALMAFLRALRPPIKMP
jgi:hypothetical protein